MSEHDYIKEYENVVIFITEELSSIENISLKDGYIIENAIKCVHELFEENKRLYKKIQHKDALLKTARVDVKKTRLIIEKEDV